MELAVKWLGQFYGVAFAGSAARAAFICTLIGLCLGAVLFFASRTSYLYLNSQDKGPPVAPITVTGGDGSTNTGQNNGHIDVDNGR